MALLSKREGTVKEFLKFVLVVVSLVVVLVATYVWVDSRTYVVYKAGSPNGKIVRVTDHEGRDIHFSPAELAKVSYQVVVVSPDYDPSDYGLYKVYRSWPDRKVIRVLDPNGRDVFLSPAELEKVQHKTVWEMPE